MITDDHESDQQFYKDSSNMSWRIKVNKLRNKSKQNKTYEFLKTIKKTNQHRIPSSYWLWQINYEQNIQTSRWQNFEVKVTVLGNGAWFLLRQYIIFDIA